jgi:L-rhamnose isomerase
VVTQPESRSLDSRAPDRSGAISTRGASDPSISREAFWVAFDRSFGRVYSYVSRRVGDRAVWERIVTDVLKENLALLMDGVDDRSSIRRLQASSDRLIHEELARRSAVESIEQPIEE